MYSENEKNDKNLVIVSAIAGFFFFPDTTPGWMLIKTSPLLYFPVRK